MSTVVTIMLAMIFMAKPSQVAALAPRVFSNYFRGMRLPKCSVVPQALVSIKSAEERLPIWSFRSEDRIRPYKIHSRAMMTWSSGDILLQEEEGSDDIIIQEEEEGSDLIVVKTAGNLKKTNLKDELKEYRTQQSAASKKPPYTVFTNAALDGICDLLPTTKEELLDVKGIGPKKLEAFGDDILLLVSKYMGATSENDDDDVKKKSIDKETLKPTKTMIDFASLTAEQRHAANLSTDSESNIFITGSAGTGKSHVLKFIVQELQRKNRNKSKLGVCAPTGVAAINVGGSTLHSYFGIGLGTGSLPSLIKKVKKNKDAMKRIDETDILIIDECSMLSSSLIETLDFIVRELRQEGQCKEQPFGGMKIIAFGDFFQLPPIYRGDGGGNRGWRPFCFDSPVWLDLGLRENMLQLKQVQRQSNDEFIDLLNQVRIGGIDENDVIDFNSRCLVSQAHPLPNDGIIPTRLYVLNRDVDSENESSLAELEGEEVVFKATIQWREKMPFGTPASVKKLMTESLSKEVPDEVRLKVGAQVMLTRNKDLERNLANGSRGVVERFAQSADGKTQIPIVRFDCGVVTPITKVEAVRYNPDGGSGCLVRMQFPLKLAWALTVHKSQGTTLTRVMIDISSAFEYGQSYVALSRARSLEGLWLERPIRLRNIMVSPQVLDFYGIE